ncbi:MAG: beta-ketoacyl-[acyl-carrier-protein] synthase family protein [Candidatus Sumerlaeaceae bacterium]|nr:beta-ketoacyl-[acyl-carrier-protein] synthase family protein [Candidatus Sumerlaeaceae bacterium]
MSESIVITGVGVVSPIGCTRDSICSNLRANLSAIRPRNFECGTQFLFANVADDFEAVSAGAMDRLSQLEQEVATVDNGLLFGLTAARTAMRESGLDFASVDPTRVGVVVSASKGQFRTLIYSIEMHERLGDKATPAEQRKMAEMYLSYPGNTASRVISKQFQFCGPMLNYPSACATGIFSTIQAAELLRTGVVDVALAGSSESTGNVMVLAGFQNMGALSASQPRPFHAKRDGFAAGEGAAVLVLERESDARARGARIIARIAGSDVRGDAYHLTGVDTRGESVEYAIRMTLKKAGWAPADVQYINAHGTGTQLNDATEAEVISRIFGQPGPLVSSLKSRIGHLLGGSASVEIALTLVALDDGFVPSTHGLDEPDPSFRVSFVPEDGAEADLQRFMKFSLGFGGHIGVIAFERVDGFAREHP